MEQRKQNGDWIDDGRTARKDPSLPLAQISARNGIKPGDDWMVHARPQDAHLAMVGSH